MHVGMNTLDVPIAELRSTTALLKAMGMRLAVEPIELNEK